MKIEAGKFYKTRDGRKVGPMIWVRDGALPEPYCMFKAEGEEYSWDYHGHYSHTYSGVSQMDLISEWPSYDDNGPIREVRRREIVPGVYGIVRLLSRGSVGVETNLYTAEQLREAAHLFNQLAEVLEEQEGEGK